MIEIYTDGSCSKNPGIGGYGIVVKEDDKIIFTHQERFNEETTNNRMELSAILKALKLTQTKFKNKQCIIYSDSSYCVRSFNEWLSEWAMNNWKNSKEQIVENLDLMQELYKYHQIDFPNFCIKKIPGHCGIIENEIADALAQDNKKKLKKYNKYLENDIFIPVI